MALCELRHDHAHISAQSRAHEYGVLIVPKGSWATRCAPLKRGRWLAAAGAFTVAVAILVAVAGASASSLSRAPCVRSQTPGERLQGAPRQSLLSILGVLRRPATPADALPNLSRLLRGPFAGGIFVNYVRRARVIAGVTYWVFPRLLQLCGSRREIMSEWKSSGAGGSGGGMGTAASIEHGQLGGTLGSFWHRTVEMLVPDGVATATLHYPAGRIGGFNRHHAPAVTINTKIVGNLMIVTVPRGGNRLMAPMTMTWHSASDTTVKTFSRL